MAHGQTITGTWNVNASGNWNDGGNWVGGTIPNGIGDTANVVRNINATRTVTLDVPVTLGTLKLGDTNNSHAFVIGGSETLTFDNGDAGAGTNPAFLNHDQNSSGGFSPSSSDRIDAPVVLNDDLVIDAARNIEFRGAWDGQGNDIVFQDVAQARWNSGGTLSNVNNFTVEVGQLRFDGAQTIGVSNFVLSTGGLGSGAQEFARFLLVNTENDQSFNMTMNGGSWFDVDYNTVREQTFTGNIVTTDLARRVIFDLEDQSTSNTTDPERHFFSGVISGSGGFSKINVGSMVLTNDNTLTGNVWVQRGRNANYGSIHLQDGGRLSDIESINLSRDASFYLDNSGTVNNDRIADDADIFVRGNNRFRLIGNAGAVVSESMGDIFIENGTGRFNMDTQGAVLGTNDVRYSFASFNRSPGGIAQFIVLDPSPDALGTGTSLASVELRDGGASADQAGSATPTDTNRKIVIGAFGGVNDIANHFMTMDGNFLRPLNWNSDGTQPGSEYLLTRDLTGAGVTPFTLDEAYNAAYGLDQNLNINYNTAVEGDTNNYAANPIRVTANSAVNSLRFGTETPTNGSNLNELGSTLSLDAGVVLYLGDSLAVNTGLASDTNGSGMILFGRAVNGTSPGSNQYITGGVLDFGSREAIIVNESGNSALIRSEIRGTGGLTKGGAQSVFLDNANSYSGPTFISEGTLYARDPGAFGNSGSVTIEGLGQLYLQLGTEIDGVDLLVGSLDNNRNVLRTDDGHNRWGGDIIIDNVDNLGNLVYQARINVNNREVLSIDGDIFAEQLSGSTSTAIRNDTALNDARIVSTEGSSAGIINLNGQFRDRRTGPVADPITADNENDVLRFLIQGNDELVINVRNQWDSAGNILHEQGVFRYEGDGNFWTDAAVAVMNPGNSQSGYIQGTGNTGEDLALVLTKPGQVFNISRWDVDGDSSNDTNPDNGITRGNIMIAGTNTTGAVSFGDGTDRIRWVNDFANERDLTIYSAEGGTVNVDAWLQDLGNNVTSSITKAGRGDVVLRGGGDADGTVEHVILAGGTLILGEYGGSFAGSNRRRVDDGAAVTFAGGGIHLDGRGSPSDRTENLTSTDTQVTAIGTRVFSGATQVIVTSDAGRATTLNIGDGTTPLTRNNGGTLHFRQNDNGGTSVMTFNSAAGPLGSAADTFDALLAPWATFANVNGPADNWTGVDSAGKVGAFSGLTADTFGATFHTDLTTSPAPLTGATEAETLRINQAVAVDLDINGQVLTINQGGILNGAGSTAMHTISDGAGGGSLTSVGTELVFHNFGSGGLTVGAVIAGTMDVTFSGTGTTTLTADNTYDGRTFFNDGTVSISSNLALGAVPVAADEDNLYFNGGTLRITGDMNLHANRGVTLGGNGAVFELDTGTTLTFGGLIQSEANVLAGYNLNPSVGRIDKTGDGTLVLHQEESNTFAGLFEIEAGILRWAPPGGTLANSTTLDLFGTNQAFFDGTVLRSGARLEMAGPLSGTQVTIFNEFFTFEGGSYIEFTNQDYDFDGLLNFESGMVVVDTVGGGVEIDFNERGGMLIGSGGIYKTGDGDIRFRENNSDWTGQLVIIDGEVDAMSAGKPLGSGTAPILLGFDTAAVGEPAPQGTTGVAALYQRTEGGYRDEMNISQDIIVRNENVASNQEKRLGARFLDHVDVVNYNGTLTLQDDLTLYYRDDTRDSTGTGNANVRNDTRSNGAPTNTEVVYINLNGNVSGDFDLITRLEQFGNGNATDGSINDAMDDLVLQAIFGLGGADNSGWTGDLQIAGLGQGTGDADRQHIISIESTGAIGANNAVIMGHDSTLRTSANAVTIGNLSVAGGSTTAVIENTRVDDGSLTVVQTVDVTWSHLFQDGVPFFELQPGETAGTLSVSKAGSAIATMTGLNTYTGTTMVNDGVLQVGFLGDGTFGQVTGNGGDEVGRTGTGLTSVNAGGTLAGTGQVQGGLALDGGTINPGDSGGADLGTLFVGDGVGSSSLTMNSGTLVFGISQTFSNIDGLGNIDHTSGGYDPVGAFAAVATGDPMKPGSMDFGSLLTSIVDTEYDHLEISGGVTWTGGRIQVVDTGSLAVNPGDVFNLVDWFGMGMAPTNWGAFDDGSMSTGGTLSKGGAFGHFDLPDLSPFGDAFRWDTSLWKTDGVLLVVTPEPGRMALMAFGLAALFMRRRR